MFIEHIEPVVDSNNNHNVYYRIGNDTCMENDMCIYITDLTFEFPIFVLEYNFYSNGRRFQYSSEEFWLDVKRSKINKEIFDELKIINFNEILNFNSVFGKNLLLGIICINSSSNCLRNFNTSTDYPRLIVSYHKTEKLPKYLINITKNISFIYNIREELSMMNGYDCDEGILIGMVITMRKKIDQIIENISFIFKNNIKIFFDLWDCQFLNSYFCKNNRNNKIFVPFIDNISEIMYCIKYNLQEELDEQVNLINVDEEKSKVITLNSYQCKLFKNENEFPWGGYIKKIIFNNKEIKNDIIIQGIYLDKY